MKISDYIVQFLEEKGVSDVFGYPGGMVTHLLDSLNKSRKMHTHINYHEQGASFSACGYAQIKGTPTVAFSTSGPGATNMLTGVCNAWFDSIPAIFISGQVNTYEGRDGLPLRQRGFQETDIISIVNSVTKYSIQIINKDDICYEIEKCWYLALEGRPGPVYMDIPMDIFRSDVDVALARHYKPTPVMYDDPNEIADHILTQLKASRKPVLLLGNGAHAVAKTTMAEFIRALNVPVVTSMPAIDLMPSDNPNGYGFIGAYGNRIANTIIDKCDLILALGSRLDRRQTGNERGQFAQNARIIRIDIDADEFTERVKENEDHFHGDIRDVIQSLLTRRDLGMPCSIWHATCKKIREILCDYDMQRPNQIVCHLSSMIPDGTIITTDVGQNQVWVAQSFKVRSSQRVIFSAGHGAMGYSLPAAIGACYAGKERTVISFSGDGGIQMNIQEMQAIVRDRLPIKVIVLNNYSLGMIRHFQEMYFECEYAYTQHTGGYTVPNFIALARAYGMDAMVYSDDADDEHFRKMIASPNPCLIEIQMHENTYTLPKSVYNKPLSCQTPPLDTKRQNMLDSL